MRRKYKRPRKKKLKDDNLTVKKHNRHWRSRRYYQEGHENAWEDLYYARYGRLNPLAWIFGRKRRPDESLRHYRNRLMILSFITYFLIIGLIILFISISYNA
ncbi:MAG: hypothetical protein EU544_02180 [Promethearchaeota archaeon]|nr:MAG: hypothetical protein EU544_02180 [Candidatus Lokiarchaeota archaeon]